MSDHSTQNRLDIAAELNIPNEFIGAIQQIDNLLFFHVKSGAGYSAQLTNTGKLKKHSLRIWS